MAYNTPSPEPLAPLGDDTPSKSLTVRSSYKWNANNAGDGLANTDMYGLPTAYVADVNTANYLRSVASEQSAAIISKGGGDGSSTTPVTATASNAAVYPSIVSEFNYYMGPDEVNTKKCLGWKDADEEWSPRCATLGGNNVWSVGGSPLALGYGGESDNANDKEDGGENDANNNN